MRAVAIDPGKTTGLAWYDEHGLTLNEEPLFVAIRWVHDMLAAKRVDRVAIEDFVITIETAKKSRETSALDGIGAVKYLTQLYDVPLAIRKSADAKALVSNDVLRALDWYQRGLPHARDASRHLVLLLMDARVIDAAAVLRAREEASGPNPGTQGPGPESGSE